MRFTEDQQKVITTRNKNILVSAAAGSGKTAVLVERILSLITDAQKPVDIDRILIVTFTNAAASEMRERIHAAIMQRLSGQPDDKNLQRQVTLVHNAQITTIDSFCLFLLRNHFHEIDLDPAFRIGDPGEIVLLEKEVLKGTLEEFYEKKETGFLKFADAYCPSGKDGKMEEMIEQLYHFSMSHPWPEQWLEECRNRETELDTATLFETDFMRFALETARGMLQDAAEMAREAARICALPDGPYMYEPMILRDQEQLEAITALLDDKKLEELFTEIPGHLARLKWDVLSRKSDACVSDERKEQVKNIRKQYKDMAAEIREQFLTSDPQKIVEREKKAAQLHATLIDLTQAFIRNLSEEKKKRNVLDFSDVEHLALKVLWQDGKPTKTAEAYQSYYYEIMIDEYQDSNLVQEILLSAISGTAKGHDNRFMVGDMKQSIYRFRLARPEIFMDKYEKYRKGEQSSTLICLKQNFRSRAEILQTANELFSKVMIPQIGGVCYDSDAALHPGAVYPEPDKEAGPYTSLMLFESGDATGENKRIMEGQMIAREIHALMNGFLVKNEQAGDGEDGGQSMRPLRYRDIVILLRSGSGDAQILQKQLVSEGIPAYVTTKEGYFDAREVSLLISFLRSIHNPYDDIALCSTALSLFFGMSQEELAWIRAVTQRGVSLYESFCEAAAYDCDRRETEEAADAKGTERKPEEAADARKTEQEPEEAVPVKETVRKIKAALSLLEELRAEAAVRTMPELIQEILMRFHYVEYVSAMPGGAQRKANIEMFVEKAVDFEKTSLHGLFQFLRYVEQLKKYQVDYGEAATLSENEDVVRIMTIHKSKGLEFPVCFVAGLDKKYNTKDTTGTLLLDADWGIASDYIDADRHLIETSLRKSMLSEKMHRDCLGEELRVLYVALTRAKEKLILTGAVSDVEKEIKKYESMAGDPSMPFSISSLAAANSSLAYLLMAYAKNPDYISFTCVTEDMLKGEQIIRTAERAVREETLEILMRESEHSGITESAAYRDLKERFSFRYPYENLAGLFSKTSVSELKKAAMEEEEVPVLFETDDIDKEYLPAFMRQETPNAGAARGSAVHRLLELLDFAKYAKLSEEVAETLQEDIQAFVESGRLSGEYASLLVPEKIAVFLQSDCFCRMAQAQERGQLYKERPFVMTVPASVLNPAYPDTEEVLVQGVIDVCFEENDGTVIVDYKTDRVGKMQELADRYRTQLDYYAQAVETITKKKVKEKMIYSFALSDTLSWE